MGRCYQGFVPQSFSTGKRILLPSEYFVVPQGVFSAEAPLDLAETSQSTCSENFIKLNLASLS